MNESETVAGIKVDYTREELVTICERAVVQLSEWGNRDTPHAHEKLGLCWVMLKAGCEFSVHPASGQSGCYTDARTIWLSISWPDFNDFEYGTTRAPSQHEMFYIPTPTRLEAMAGRDWY